MFLSSYTNFPNYHDFQGCRDVSHTSPYIIKKICIKFIGGVETIFSILQFNNPFGSYRFGELERLLVSLFILSVFLRNKIKFQVLIRTFSVQIDVKVQSNIARSCLSLSEPYWFF